MNHNGLHIDVDPNASLQLYTTDMNENMKLMTSFGLSGFDIV